jgi:hypothetical protein
LNPSVCACPAAPINNSRERDTSKSTNVETVEESIANVSASGKSVPPIMDDLESAVFGDAGKGYIYLSCLEL